MWLKRWLVETGYETKLVDQHHRHQRQDLRRRAGGEREAGRGRVALVPRGHRRPRSRPPGRRADGGRDGRRPDRDDRGARRARLRLRVRRRRLLPGDALPRVRPPERAAARPGRGAGAEPAQGGPARLRALEGDEGGRGHVLGLAVGDAAARLAHRVLGHVREAPRARVRDPRRRARPRVPASRERDRAVARARAPVRADLDAQRAAHASAARRCTSRPATTCRCRRPSSTGAARRCSSSTRPASTGSRSSTRTRRSRRLPRARRAFATSSATRPSPRRRARGSASRLRSTTTSRRLPRSRSCTSGATTTSSAARSRSSGSSRSRARTRRRPRSPTSPRAGRRRARRATSARPTGSATSSRPPAGKRATSPAATGSSSSVTVTRELVYGRNAVRSSTAGRARLSRRGSRSALRRRSRGSSSGPRAQVKPERELTEAAGRATTRASSRGASRSATRTRTSSPAPRSPLLVCLDQVTDPHNLGAVARSAEGAGATGIVLPAHGSARVTPAVCRSSAGAVEHLPIAVVPNLARYLAEVKSDDLWAYAADAEGTVPLWGADLTGGVALVLGAEGKGVRPLVRRTCDARDLDPARGQGRVAQRQRARHCSSTCPSVRGAARQRGRCG